MNVFAKFNLKKQKRMEEEKKLVEKTEENLKKKKEEESLSVKRDLDSNKLRNMLMTYINGSWSEYSKELFKAVSQLNKMDEQQKKLERLIQNNGAESLSDTQDVLEKTEQYICKNVRKIINYIDVADPNDKAARNKVEEKLVRCCENNEIVLEKTNDFLFAMADYLNSQGDDDESVQTMEIYKETILNAID